MTRKIYGSREGGEVLRVATTTPRMECLWCIKDGSVQRRDRKDGFTMSPLLYFIQLAVDRQEALREHVLV